MKLKLETVYSFDESPDASAFAHRYMPDGMALATSEGFVDLLSLTLANGADVKSLDSFDGTGLIRAAHRGRAAARTV